MKKILVVYYSQSGQLTEIVQSVLAPLKKNENISVVFEEIRPQKHYPFPWSRHQFCDVFPEAFQETPCKLEPFGFNSEDEFDLIILAYTVWYLSPSIPVSAFLQSPEAQKVIRHRPVITLIGCRNMWLLAQEKVKRRIGAIGGEIKGNIVLMDRAMNLIGIVTIAAWMLTGKKDRFLRIFPRPGISDRDIQESGRFGNMILEALSGEKMDLDQQALNRHGAVTVIAAYIIFEQRIHKVFTIWSKFISQKGGPADPQRKIRVRLFFYYLLCAIILIAPLATLVSWIVKIFNRQKTKTAVAYFSQNQPKTRTE
ncbi:MAG: hypothetical protein Q8P24_07285 [Desulfobacterales bacterium]|nr:hypothetical protein [Desulfobacterales bacterium]